MEVSVLTTCLTLPASDSSKAVTIGGVVVRASDVGSDQLLAPDVSSPDTEVFEDDAEDDDLDQVDDVYDFTRGACVNHFDGGCPVNWCRHHLDSMDRATLRPRPIRRDSVVPTCSLILSAEGPRTLEEVAILLGLTRERVRQIEQHALKKMGRGLIVRQIVGRREIVGRRGLDPAGNVKNEDSNG
jgi:hypothetical protein